MANIVFAIEKLRKGQWDEAHEIAQNDPTQIGSWLHGIVHIVEGDEFNARYWYNRAQRPFPGMNSVESEMKTIVAQESHHD